MFAPTLCKKRRLVRSGMDAATLVPHDRTFLMSEKNRHNLKIWEYENGNYTVISRARPRMSLSLPPANCIRKTPPQTRRNKTWQGCPLQTSFLGLCAVIFPANVMAMESLPCVGMIYPDNLLNEILLLQPKLECSIVSEGNVHELHACISVAVSPCNIGAENNFF